MINSFQQARELVRDGWRVNLVTGSITRFGKEGMAIIDDAVWHAMKDIQAENPKPAASASFTESPRNETGADQNPVRDSERRRRV